MVLAAALLAIAWATLQWMTWRTELVTLHTELRLAELSLMDAQQRREADHILWQHQLAATSPSADSSVDSSNGQLDSASPEIVLLASPRAASPPTVGAVIWNPATREGVFTAQNLPTPAPGQVYRLWAVDPQSAHPIAAGVVGVDPQTGSARGPFKPGRSLPATVKFLVSLERQDGGTAPDGPIVLASP